VDIDSSPISGAAPRQQLGDGSMTLAPPQYDQIGAFDDQTRRTIRHHLRSSAPVYLMGFLGTLAAGALFPVVLSLLRAVIRGQPGLLVRWDFIAFAGVGGLYGIVLAGAAAAAVFPIAVAFQFLAGAHSARAVIASIAGGWSGVVATLAMFSGEQPTDRPLMILTAMLLGQMLAGLAARDVQMKQDYVGIWADPPSPSNFSLQRLLRFAATLVLMAALLASFRLSATTLRNLGYAAGFQAMLMSTYFTVGAIRARISRADV
jgi:hypothetical protein